MYLLVIIGNEYWFCTLHSARRGLFDSSDGRTVIERLTKADPWRTDIKVVDKEELDRVKKTHTEIT